MISTKEFAALRSIVGRTTATELLQPEMLGEAWSGISAWLRLDG